MRSCLIVIFFLFTLCLSACSAKAPDSTQFFKGQSEEKIFLDGEKAMKKHNYEDAIKHFETLNARYPFGQFSEKSLRNLIYAYYKKDNAPFALATAAQYIRLYPRGEQVDYAYYMRGFIQLKDNQGFFERHFPVDLAKRDINNLHKAYIDFNQLVRYFPKSKYAPDAKKHMMSIQNTLAQHELQVAEFYYNHESYVAAANRANGIVQNYQQTPTTPKALVLMVKSYQKLNLHEEATSALRVLQTNFPRSKELKSLKQHHAKN